ncbi:hypothetical protein BH09DEP1_BH09DEP1_0570 [soil metagenome]
MKYRLLLFTLCLFNYSYSLAAERCNPGCIRKNSDGIRRDLLFMHLDNGHVDLVISMLDTESIDFTNQSGKSINRAIEEAQDKQKIDINRILQHIEQLKKQKTHQAPEADLPD